MAKGKYKRKKERQVLRQTTVDSIGLSVRVSNLLKKYEIFSLFDLVNHTEDSLLALNGFGSGAVKEIHIRLSEMNITWPKVGKRE